LVAATNWRNHVRKHVRILDLVCFTPSAVQLVFYACNGQLQLHHHVLENENTVLWKLVEVTRVCRAVRILELSIVREEMNILAKTIGKGAHTLAGPMLLFAMFFTCAASWFVLVENFVGGPEAVNMKSIPESMYWCSFYVLGEWVHSVFSDGAGSRMVIFFNLFGVTMLAIPTSIFVDAAENTLVSAIEERNKNSTPRSWMTVRSHARTWTDSWSFGFQHKQNDTRPTLRPMPDERDFITFTRSEMREGPGESADEHLREVWGVTAADKTAETAFDPQPARVQGQEEVVELVRLPTGSWPPRPHNRVQRAPQFPLEAVSTFNGPTDGVNTACVLDRD